MPGHAGIHIHVSCSAEKRKSAGLDGDIQAKLYLSWVPEGEDPRNKSNHRHVAVDVLGAELRPPGEGGDDAVTVTEALARALHAAGAPAARAGTSSIYKPPTKRLKKATVATHGYIELDDVESIDCGCCDDKGKVRIDFYGNVKKRGTRRLRDIKPGEPVEVIPVRLGLKPKGSCPPLREPLDPTPGPLGPGKVPPGTQVTPLTVPPPPPPPPPWPTTPSAPATPPSSPAPTPPSAGPHGGRFRGPPPTPAPWEDPNDPTPPPPPPPPPYAPPPVAEPWREGPYVIAAGLPGGAGAGVRGKDMASGVFHLGFGSHPGAADVTWLFVPWPVIRTRPEEQLAVIQESLESAGVVCSMEAAWLLILGEAATARPLVEFRVTLNYAGRGFPWVWIADLWQERRVGHTPFAVGWDWIVEERVVDVTGGLAPREPGVEPSPPLETETTAIQPPHLASDPEARPTILTHRDVGVDPDFREPLDRPAPPKP